jgi:DNA polymerase-3 subunit beta
MKISVNKEAFIKTWNLAERSAGSSGSMNIFSAVRMSAVPDKVEMQATDIRTSIICSALGVTVIEPGEAVIPIKGVSDLFKKARSEDFTLQISEGGNAVMISGSSRYKFSTYPVGDFPKLSSSSQGKFFCSILVSNLISALDRGTLCASSSDEFPQYLSSALLEMENGALNVVSTDKRRLALCRGEVIESGECEPMLIPMKGLKELQRILGMIDPSMEMKILSDDSQAYFLTSGVEFAVRKVESKFPQYSKILPSSHRTTVDIERSELLSAVERVDIVVRDYNRTVMLKADNSGECVLSGRAQEFGEAVENIRCDVQGESLFTGFNTRFFLDAIRALDEQTARMLFNGADGHMLVRNLNSDSFLCLVAPVELSAEELERDGAESNLDSEVDVL